MNTSCDLTLIAATALSKCSLDWIVRIYNNNQRRSKLELKRRTAINTFTSSPITLFNFVAFNACFSFSRTRDKHWIQSFHCILPHACTIHCSINSCKLCNDHLQNTCHWQCRTLVNRTRSKHFCWEDERYSPSDKQTKQWDNENSTLTATQYASFLRSISGMQTVDENPKQHCLWESSLRLHLFKSALQVGFGATELAVGDADGSVESASVLVIPLLQTWQELKPELSLHPSTCLYSPHCNSSCSFCRSWNDRLRNTCRRRSRTFE